MQTGHLRGDLRTGRARRSLTSRAVDAAAVSGVCSRAAHRWSEGTGPESRSGPVGALTESQRSTSDVTSEKQQRMTLFHQHDRTTLYHGDCLSVMPALGVQVDSIITDPPYGISFMGKDWDHGVPGVAFWEAAMGCTKPGGMLLAFGGTRIFHRLACAIEDAGWEIRDCIMWVYGSGFPKSLDISKAIDKSAGAERDVLGRSTTFRPATRNNGTDGFRDRRTSANITAPATDAARLWTGYGTALKPAWEPIIVAMKPLDGTFAENAQWHGVAGMAIDAGRVDGRERTEYGLATSKRSTVNVYGQSGGPADFDSSKGRFPANLIHDGSDEVLAGFPLGGGNDRRGKGNGSRPSGFGNVGSEAGSGDPCGQLYADSGSAARFFYCAKASRAERGKTNTHPTVKPLALMRYLCRLTKTPTGGIVLDPFAGSGSTLIAASQEGREAIGIEQDEAHCRIIVDRLGVPQKQRVERKAQKTQPAIAPAQRTLFAG